MDNLKTSLSNCRSCRSISVQICASRSNFPLYIWPLAKEDTTPLEDIDVYICNDCGYIQLQNMNDQTISEIYRDEAFNLENRNQKLERFRLMTLEDNKKFENTKVLEIGGGRNTFLGVLPDSSEKWVADFSIDDNVKSEVDGAFEGNFTEIDITQKSFDYVFMFHVLEHFNQPGIALEKTKSLLSEKGKIIVEVPNFSYEAKVRPEYTIFHMHISLFTKTSLISLMMRHGFSSLNFFKKDEVLLAEFCLDNPEMPKNHKEHSLDELTNVDSNISRCSKKLHTQIKEIKTGKIAIFGAGGSATLFLYNYPFLIERVSFALDNSMKKVGRSLCNGMIPIVHPDQITDLNISHVIVLDQAHIDYVANEELNYINIGAFYES